MHPLSRLPNDSKARRLGVVTRRRELRSNPRRQVPCPRPAAWHDRLSLVTALLALSRRRLSAAVAGVAPYLVVHNRGGAGIRHQDAGAPAVLADALLAVTRANAGAVLADLLARCCWKMLAHHATGCRRFATESSVIKKLSSKARPRPRPRRRRVHRRPRPLAPRLPLMNVLIRHMAI